MSENLLYIDFVFIFFASQLRAYLFVGLVQQTKIFVANFLPQAGGYLQFFGPHQFASIFWEIPTLFINVLDDLSHPFW